MPQPPPTPSPTPARSPRDARSPAKRGLSRSAWRWIAAAFGAGLLLFLALWNDQRDDTDFYRADGAAPTAAGQVFEPLPAPLPDGEAGAAPAGRVDGPASDAPLRRGDDASMAGTRDAPPDAAPPPPRPEPAPSADALAPGAMPVPLATPAPAYPPAALRRGESGTVLLRVHVGADGVPYAVDVVQSSRSRLLDRAAIEAVKRWRFRPAQRDGRAVSGEVRVPISFSPR